MKGKGDPPELEARIAAVAGRQYGVVTRRQLRGTLGAPLAVAFCFALGTKLFPSLHPVLFGGLIMLTLLELAGPFIVKQAIDNSITTGHLELLDQYALQYLASGAWHARHGHLLTTDALVSDLPEKEKEGEEAMSR